MSLSSKIFIIKRRLGLVTASELKQHFLKIGIRMGKNVYLFSSRISIDEQRPWMIEIGDYTKITSGVTILQHDYSRSVLRRKYGEIIGESKKTVIGKNCFIGINATILMGTQIGDNCIIGAGSVVTGKFPDDVVIAGNPARIVCTLDKYYKKRKSKYIEEAVNTFIEFTNVYHREPSIIEMGSFWPIFMPKSIKELRKEKVFTRLSGDDEKDIINHWLYKETPIFPSYKDFKEYAYSVKCNAVIGE